MKPTDERINNELRKALKRRFDSFEVEPSGRLSSEVLRGIQQSNLSGFRRFSTILILVLVGGMGLWGGHQFLARPEQPLSTRPASAQAKPGRGFPADVVRTKGQSSIKPAQSLFGRNGSDSDLTPLKSNPATISPTRNRPVGQTRSARQPSDHLQAAIRQPFRNSGLYPHPIAPENTAETEVENILSPSSNPPIGIAPPPDASRQSRLRIAAQRITPHPLRFTRPISTPTPEPPTLVPAGQVLRASPARWRGVLSFTPTNTYQRLTVLPQTYVHYQNFELPPLFSVQTAGFNLRGGVEKKGFQFLVNYGRFTQKVAYEIALDEYLVQPQGTGTYTVAREGKSQIHEITFQLVGLSLQKKFTVPVGSRTGFYVYTGASLSHDLSTSHNLAWGTLGAGKSWPVAPAASLSLIPQLEIGLNTVKTNNDAFKNRFYRLGLAVELTFGKN